MPSVVARPQLPPMTRQELCALLELSPDVAAGALLKARAARIEEKRSDLAQDNLGKPIKIKLTLELAELESAGVSKLVTQLELIARAESLATDIDAELAKPKEQWTRSVIELLCKKLGALLPTLPEEALRFSFEKRLAEVAEKIIVAPRPSSSATPATVRNPARVLAPSTDVPSPASGVRPGAGGLLQLVPKVADGTLHRTGSPIHFVARPRFVLGRQRSKSDFVTWFLPESPANQQKTDTISRANTTFFLKGNQIWVHDGEALGDGSKKPSVGTIIDGVALTIEPRQLNFAKERHLRLGQAGYELKALHLPAIFPGGPPGAVSVSHDTSSAQATMVLPQRALGCLRLQAVSCREVVAETVWLFSEAALGSGANCAVVLASAGLPTVALRVHFWQGGFWLEIPREAAGLPAELDGRSLQPGVACALQAAHQFRLGALHYELKVSP